MYTYYDLSVIFLKSFKPNIDLLRTKECKLKYKRIYIFNKYFQKYVKHQFSESIWSPQSTSQLLVKQCDTVNRNCKCSCSYCDWGTVFKPDVRMADVALVGFYIYKLVYSSWRCILWVKRERCLSSKLPE